ncbi:MAG: ribosomal protein S18-alanine N-acetyltransferase [Candidatus Bathyarchaeia archaeon]
MDWLDMHSSSFEVKVRAFSDSDLNRILEIERLSFPDPWPRLEFQYLSRLPQAVFLVAEVDGLPVGYIVAENCSLTRRGSGRILNLAVHPWFRRRGVASRLLREAEAMLRVREIWLEVRRSNNTAIDFYLKHGFKPVGILPKYYGDEDAVRMVKKSLTSNPKRSG